jgi:PAS domain S-box-containing protein
MNRTLRVLHVEDQERDVALLTRHLSRAGYDLISERVETAATMNLALESRKWDVILCDYSMPHFNALSALSTLKETGLDIPFIIISGTVGEAVAVEAMRAGAHDYLMKGNLVRLAPTIERELHDAENRRARKFAEESHKASEAELRALFAAMTDPIFVIDAQGRCLKTAPTSHTYLFTASAEMIGKTMHESFPKEQADLFLEKIHRALDEGQIQRVEYSLQVEGSEVWFEGSVSPMSEDSVVWIARDITESKRAEERLRQQLDFTKAITASLGEGVYALDRRGRVTFMNPAAEMALGWTQAELLGQEVHEIIHFQYADSAIRPASECPLLEVLNSGQTRKVESDAFTRKDGTIFPVSYTSSPIVSGGQVVGAVLAFHDITERKRVEQELRKSEERYRDLVENARDIIYTTDLEGNYTSVNRAGEQIFGYAREEVLKLSQAQVVAPEYLEKAQQMLTRKLAGEAVTIYELEAITKDGLRITIEINTRLIYRDGVLVGVQGIGRDITERKRAEEMLHAADRRAVEEYERLLDRLANLALSFGTARDLLTIYRGLRDFSLSLTPSFALVICLYDEARAMREGVYFYTNGKELDIPALVSMPVRSGPAGRAIKTGTVVVSNDYLKDLRDRDPILIGFEEDNTPPQSALIAPMTIMGRTIGTIEVQSYELTAYTREHVTAMQMAANLAANAVENVRLLNLEREKEEQLRQSQKMEAVGQLAGGIAHDFNNLLTAITGYSELTLRRLQPEDPLYRNIEEVKKAGERAASLTRQLLAFSRKQVLQPKVLGLNSIISEVEKMLCRLIGEDIDLRTVLEPQLGRIKADPGQIEQVLLNLAVNARDAMPHGGKLTIETENVYLDEGYAGQHIAVNPGHYVMLAVSDNGTGIDERTRARIFEPFFTTKEAGKGTGLGLSTVYGIVKQSGGNIWVYSEVGRGTSFKVYLPRVDEGAQEYKRSAEPKDALQGTEMILLAEDEDVVRKLTREVLEMCGYKVLEAANGGAALLICERQKEPIHLLITDVIMPEMGGRELSDRLSQLHPEMKVLYMSGYTDNAIVHQGVLNEGANFIQKPFSPDALARKVREVLGETK